MEREPYVILGACNPPLASEGLDAEPGLAPCSRATWWSTSMRGSTRVAAVEPERMLAIVGNEELDPIAQQVREDLGRVVEEIAKS